MGILPSDSTNYEQLEGSMEPSRMGRRLRWRMIVLAAAVTIGLVWFIGLGEPQSFSCDVEGEDYVDYPSGGEVNVDMAPLPGPPLPIPTHSKSAADGDEDKDVHAVPLSFENDPDPSKTVHCTKPYNPGARLVQYALMIEAGSTGSRIHVYKFNNCGPSVRYEYKVFKMTQSGLPMFAGKPLEAARSLDVLLNEAVRVVPVGLRACTPVAVKATAGLRVLPGSQSVDILKAVEKRLRERYPFQMSEKDAVVIMDGKDEGVYTWITANYLLDTIRGDSEAASTYAVLDLGGAITRVVFEPTFSEPNSSFVEGDQKTDLKFLGKTHVLYEQSYLGYGLMRARRHVHQLVDFNATIRTHGNDTADSVIENPCISEGKQRVVLVEDGPPWVSRKVIMDGAEVGSFEACSRVIELAMAKNAICRAKPCLFNGVDEPSLLDTFPSGKVLLLSYFDDRLFPLLPQNAPITVETIASTARDVCRGRPAWLERWGAQPKIMNDLDEHPEWCLDLTFMYSLLRRGYGLEDARDVAISRQMQNKDFGWYLGATLAMVGEERACRV